MFIDLSAVGTVNVESVNTSVWVEHGVNMS